MHLMSVWKPFLLLDTRAGDNPVLQGPFSALPCFHKRKLGSLLSLTDTYLILVPRFAKIPGEIETSANVF